MKTHPWRLLLLRRLHSRSNLRHISTPLSLSHSHSHGPLPPPHLSAPLFQNPILRPFSSSSLAIEPKDADHVIILTDIFSKSFTTDEIKLELDSHNIAITHDLVVRVLQGLNSAPDVARRVFGYVSERESERLSSKSYNWMLGILGLNGCVKEFWDLVEVMKRKGYGVKKGAAVRALERFEKEGLGTDVEVLREIYACGSVGDSVEKVCSRVCKVVRGEVWGDEVEKRLCELNVSYSSKLVSMVLGSLGSEPNKALIFFRWVSESNLFEHDEGSYNAVLRVLGREDCVDRFWRVADEMRGAGFEMARETYIEVLGKFVKRKMIKDAVGLYEFAMRGANKPSIQDCTYFLRKVVVTEELDMDLFMRVIVAFTEGGNVLTDLNLDAVLRSLTSVGRLGECNRILQAMEEGGFSPSDTLRSKIAFQISSKCEKEEANVFVDTMEAFGSNSHYKVWSALVEGHCVAGQLDEASECFHKLVEKEGVSRAGYALELLVNSYCNRNRALDACKLVVDLIHEKQLKPLHSTYKLLTSKVLVQGGLKEALELLDCMKVDGFPPFLDPFINYLSKTGTADEAKFFLDGMTVKRVPSTTVFVRVFEAYFKAGRHNEAQDLISKCPQYIRNHADILDLFFTMRSEAATATCIPAQNSDFVPL